MKNITVTGKTIIHAPLLERDVTEKENVIESSMSTGLSELSMRSKDDHAGE